MGNGISACGGNSHVAAKTRSRSFCGVSHLDDPSISTENTHTPGHDSHEEPVSNGTFIIPVVASRETKENPHSQSPVSVNLGSYQLPLPSVTLERAGGSNDPANLSLGSGHTSRRHDAKSASHISEVDWDASNSREVSHCTDMDSMKNEILSAMERDHTTGEIFATTANTPPPPVSSLSENDVSGASTLRDHPSGQNFIGICNDGESRDVSRQKNSHTLLDMPDSVRKASAARSGRPSPLPPSSSPQPGPMFKPPLAPATISAPPGGVITLRKQAKESCSTGSIDWGIEGESLGSVGVNVHHHVVPIPRLKEEDQDPLSAMFERSREGIDSTDRRRPSAL